MYKILDKINKPDDIKKLSIEDLNLLSVDVSNYIHDVVSEKGGHYSSPIGAIDLTIALHYVYNTPIDKLIWDVGHQAYAHKILTGRKKEFKNIRQYNGISGFLKIDESEYDSFGAGRASTSISAGLGYAHSRDKDNKSHQIVSIIGDGAMTGGLAYEGLNNLGFHKTQLTVVLNDNSYSISESVGALSKYLTRIVTNPTYNKLRKDIWNLTGKIPTFSNVTRRPFFNDMCIDADSSDSTPTILMSGLTIFMYAPIPDISPPPPIGMKIACIFSLHCRRSSIPMVP